MTIKLKLFLFPLLAACLFSACKSELPLDVVMEDGNVYFVLEEAREISSVRVMPAAGAKTLMWEMRHNMATPVAGRKYPSVRYLRYGEKLDEFPVVTGPLELARNTEYVVAMETGDSFAQETFLLTGDGKVVMPKPAFKRQRGRVYSAVRGKDGRLEFVGK